MNKKLPFLRKENGGKCIKMFNGFKWNQWWGKSQKKLNISCKIANNRKGDIDKLGCSSIKAKKILNWYPINSNIEKIIKDEILWTKYLKKKKIKRRFKNYI